MAPVLTLVLRLVGALLDEYVQLKLVWNVALDLNPDAKADQSSETAMGHRGIELYPDHIDIIGRGLLHDYSLLAHDIQVLEGLWLLRIPDCA